MLSLNLQGLITVVFQVYQWLPIPYTNNSVPDNIRDMVTVLCYFEMWGRCKYISNFILFLLKYTLSAGTDMMVTKWCTCMTGWQLTWSMSTVGWQLIVFASQNDKYLMYTYDRMTNNWYTCMTTNWQLFMYHSMITDVYVWQDDNQVDAHVWQDDN